MIRVTKAPPIKFTCTWCKAENEGDVTDFEPLHTMPPSFRAQCGFCHLMVNCFPHALISAVVGGRYG